jgi:hypothetical protein
VAISERLKVQCMYAGNLVVFGRDVLHLSNLIRDVVLIGMILVPLFYCINYSLQ